MHAHQIIQRLLGHECPSIHAKRRACLAQVVQAALLGGLGVVRIAKQVMSATSLRHRIKSCDRLLSNPHLARERVQIYQAMVRRLLRKKRQVQVIVDWSEVREDGSAQLLRAAAVIKGRAFTLYEEVHPEKLLNSPSVHASFMRTLQAILPLHCEAVIITDAGFRSTWFKLLNELGFDWIGRIRNRDHVCKQGTDTWSSCKTLYEKACSKARDLGEFFYVRSNATLCRLVLYKAKPKGRHCLTKSGAPARSRRSKKNSASHREPWLLAVSPKLTQLRAEEAIRMYAGRMQIEQTFRDLKNAKWGMGLSNSQTKGLHRLAALLLIGALVTYVLWMIGLAARNAGYEIGYGSRAKAANTLSVLSLAMHWLDDYRRPRLTIRDLKNAFAELSSMVRSWEFEG
jgi:hypothetical protein